MNTIETYSGKIPVLSTEEMIEVDRLMIEEYGIVLIQMMENAGRCLAIVAMREFLKSNFSNKKVIILAGTGGNGGGALVCARRLHNWGVGVSVYLNLLPHFR
ncbi:MAG: NAD(P)H-hydrate epimerase [Bacteroidota bacterium]